MAVMDAPAVPIQHPDSLFIGGRWVAPSSSSVIKVIDSGTEELFFTVPEAQAPDIDRAVAAARVAFDEGPWPRMTHAERAAFLRAFGREIGERAETFGQIWPRQSGVVYSAAMAGIKTMPGIYDFYAGLAETFPFEERVRPSAGEPFGMLVREPVGVVGAIIPWNGPLNLITYKLAPALLSGCTVVLKAAPEAPGEAYVMAEIAEKIGLPEGVLNVVTADREVSELLVRDPRVDKIAFTGSTVAGRRIASIMGERIGRVTLELGGKSAAVVLDDIDLQKVASVVSAAECRLTGQVCASLTRVVVSQHRHDELVDALEGMFSQVVVGDPFASDTQMGPLAMSRQRDRVEGFIAKGVEEGARLVTGGGRPKHLDRGYFVEPTVFANVENRSTIGQTEIFGPVLSVIPVANEAEAVRVANDTIYGLNSSIFTDDPDRAYDVARQLRAGTVGGNGYRPDFGISFGGFKQSGIGREGGTEGMHAYLEPKLIILDEVPAKFS